MVFIYSVFAPMQDESYSRRFRSLLLCSWDVFRALINSLGLMSLYRKKELFVSSLWAGVA